jgi:hypothetical protein
MYVQDLLVPKFDALRPGANPTTSSYNASVVKIYNATSSLVRFQNQNYFLVLWKRSTLLQRWRCSCKFRNSTHTRKPACAQRNMLRRRYLRKIICNATELFSSSSATQSCARNQGYVCKRLINIGTIYFLKLMLLKFLMEVGMVFCPFMEEQSAQRSGWPDEFAKNRTKCNPTRIVSNVLRIFFWGKK